MTYSTRTKKRTPNPKETKPRLVTLRFTALFVQIQTDKVVGVGVGTQEDDEEYYDDEEKASRQHQATQYDENALAIWLQSIYPKISQLLETNYNSKIFDNYEVFWDEERGENELWQKMQTNYDFNEANRATQ